MSRHGLLHKLQILPHNSESCHNSSCYQFSTIPKLLLFKKSNKIGDEIACNFADEIADNFADE